MRRDRILVPRQRSREPVSGQPPDRLTAWHSCAALTWLFKCRTLAEQQAYFDSRLDLRAVRLLLRVAFNRRVYAMAVVMPTTRRCHRRVRRPSYPD